MKVDKISWYFNTIWWGRKPLEKICHFLYMENNGQIIWSNVNENKNATQQIFTIWEQHSPKLNCNVGFNDNNQCNRKKIFLPHPWYSWAAKASVLREVLYVQFPEKIPVPLRVMQQAKIPMFGPPARTQVQRYDKISPIKLLCIWKKRSAGGEVGYQKQELAK